METKSEIVDGSELLDTKAVLYAAVMKSSELDMPRLALADYLEETGDPDNIVQAEYIRLKIEWLRSADKDRNIEIGIEVNKIINTHPKFLKQDMAFAGTRRAAQFRRNRGLFDEIILRHNAFFGGACERCDGRGESFVNGSLGTINCLECKGLGRFPHGYSVSNIFRDFPITSVILSDRGPIAVGDRFELYNYLPTLRPGDQDVYAIDPNPPFRLDGPLNEVRRRLVPTFTRTLSTGEPAPFPPRAVIHPHLTPYLDAELPNNAQPKPEWVFNSYGGRTTRGWMSDRSTQRVVWTSNSSEELTAALNRACTKFARAAAGYYHWEMGTE